MNFKVLAAAVALLAICAEARIIGSDDGDLQQIDLSDNNLVRFVQDNLNRVDAVLQDADSAVLNAVTAATEAALAVAKNEVDRWNQRLQDVINRTDAVNAAEQQCRAQQPSLQSVAEDLGKEVQFCVKSADNQTYQSTLRTAAERLAQDARKVFSDCGVNRECLVAGIIKLKILPQIVDFTDLAELMFVQLGENIGRGAGPCVVKAINTRGAAANAIINAVSQCVNASLNPTTTSA